MRWHDLSAADVDDDHAAPVVFAAGTEVPEALVCAICLEVMRGASIVRCGHSFW